MYQFLSGCVAACILIFVIDVATDRGEPAPVAAEPTFQLVRLPELSALEQAVWSAESSNAPEGMKVKDGKDGEIGPMQITEGCWIDATEHDPSIGGVYRDCYSLEYSIKIFRAYMDRYGRGLTDCQRARIWNGGPDGHLEDCTLHYPALDLLGC